jgi:hypothetical protein
MTFSTDWVFSSESALAASAWTTNASLTVYEEWPWRRNNHTRSIWYQEMDRTKRGKKRSGKGEDLDSSPYKKRRKGTKKGIARSCEGKGKERDI